ncbi:MAG: hypothetical protein AAFO89_04200, partial [Planctomycetota bacterium]
MVTPPASRSGATRTLLNVPDSEVVWNRKPWTGPGLVLAAEQVAGVAHAAQFVLQRTDDGAEAL